MPSGRAKVCARSFGSSSPSRRPGRRAREEYATSLDGVCVIHTAGLIELSTDLPVVIEVVDDQAHVDRLLPILDEMITGGALVTVERVRALRYAAGPKREPGV